MKKDKRILMVCLGNICRSPLAEGLLRHKIQQLGLSHQVDSAGTANYHVGEAPDVRSQKVALAHGFDISLLKGRQMQKADATEFDFIFVMDKSNLQNAKEIIGEDSDSQAKLIMDVLHPEKNIEVPDPYYGDMSNFQQVYDMLDQACDQIIQNYLR